MPNFRYGLEQARRSRIARGLIGQHPKAGGYQGEGVSVDMCGDNSVCVGEPASDEVGVWFQGACDTVAFFCMLVCLRTRIRQSLVLVII